MKKGLYTLFLLLGIIVDAFSQSMIISGGNDHGIALCSKGQIFAWGYNAGNRLCLKDPSGNNVEPSPKEVDTGNLTFSMLSAGSGGHSVALSCNKTVYCWGQNDNFQCGRNTGGIIGDKPVPVLKGVTDGFDEDGNPGGDYLGNVKYISATTNASMAIMDDGKGRVVIWGRSNGQKNHLPQYILDENNNPLENVIHITGGDDNILLIVGDSPDAKVGTVYSLGNWNGRGAEDATTADSWVAKPVLKGTGKGDVSSGETIKNVRTSGLADGGGFVVEGGTGYVYAWGNSGWWGPCGLQLASAGKYAEKVTSGEYKEITGESYLTDVIQVTGGNGNGTAVTKEGYVLYWGSNEAIKENGTGGVIPNSTYASTLKDTKEIGPVFANYCAGEHKGIATEHRVEDAVAIARGDLYGFMVNSEGKFYAWGSCARPVGPGQTEMSGTLGIGKVDEVSTCFKEIKGISCRSKDLCPEAFMLPKVDKCPDKPMELYSGFSPLAGTEDKYVFKWSLDGELLDPTVYNTESITITKAGLYRVDISYIGIDVPCENCPDAFAECLVEDMPMPIDKIITISCVTDLDKSNPTAASELNYEFLVNDKFYSVGTKTTWKVFESATSTTPLDTVVVLVNDKGSFKVDGSKVTFNNNAPIDTTYSIFIEDATKMSAIFFDSTASTGKKYGQLSATQPFYMYVTAWDDIVLESAKLAYTIGWDGVSCSLTPKIYKAEPNSQGNPIAGRLVNTGTPISFVTKDCKLDNSLSGQKEIVELDFKGLKLEGDQARGANYFIFFEASSNINSVEIFTDMAPFSDEFGGTSLNVHQVGQANSLDNFSSNGTHAIFDLQYSKLTSYTCGRIELESKLYCPPCNNPDKLEIVSTSHTIKSDVDPKYKKVVELCKESAPLDLDIEPLVGKTDPAATFDILWYDEDPQKNASATPIKSDESGTATTLPYTTDWATVAGAANITEDVEKVYYVYVHDHEKVGCPNYDSIKVIAHPVPADTLVWDTFCLTSPITEPDFTKTALGNTITWTTDPTGTFATLTDTKSFDYTVTDAVTGCISGPHTYTVTVNKTDVPQVDNAPSTTVDPTAYFDLNSTRQGPLAAGFSLRWYDDSQVLLTSSETNISRANEGSLTFYVEMYNEETQCASEKVEVVLTINDALPPDVHDESLCIDDVIDLANYVTINKKTGESDSDYELLWYTDPDAPKGTGTETSSFQTTFTATAANAGTPYEVWVSQKNVSTNAESEKKKITITVHKVATLDLTANTTTYCVYETANAFTATENNDGDFTGKKWSTSKRNDHELSSPQDNLSPTIQRGAPTAYYVLPYFENPRTYNYASDICYGTVQEIDVTVNYTEIPNPEKPTVYVQYLQAQGDANGGRYNKITVQDPLSVTPDNSTDYELVWYNESGTEIPEPAPTYNATEPAGKREEKFQVAQRNKITGCISEKKDVIAVISTFPMPTTQALSFCQESDELKSSYILTADINTAGGIPATEYTLVWYKEDPEVNPGAAEYAFIDLNAENLTYDYASVLEKDTIYYVRQRHARGDSPASPLVVTIFSKPRLLTDNPDPICLGDQIDIRDYYSISNKINNKNYDNEYLSGTGGNDPIAKKHGEYRTRAYFTLSSGETCYSDWAIFNVTVNELSVKIDGEQTTCPGISKELTAVLDTNHMFTDVAKYTWNGVQSNNQTFTSPTATNGQITVTLDVEMGACRATAPAHTINVVNPGLNGDITFTERGNTKNGTKAVTQFVEFEGCGTTLNFELNVDHTEDAFTYKNLSNNNVTNSTFESGKAFLTFDGSIDAGMYEITYTNVCETSFVLNIEDRSHSLLGFATSPEVCEGDPWEITIKEDDGVKIKDFNFNPSKHTIRWKVGSTPLPQFDNSIYLKIPSTTSADNGFYSYTVTSAGCVYTENVPKNKDFISRPIVTIDSASLENNGVFEVVRGRNKDLTIPLLNPTSAADLAKLNIVWNELKGNSYEAIAGETSSTYSVSNVDEDHYYKVNFAGGKRSGDHDFCGTSIEVSLKVDAELAIKTEVVGDDRNKKTDMCIGEENVGILIDTAGTGTLLHPDKLKFRLEELIPGKEAKKIDWVEENGKLFAEINPSKSAGYRVIYEYTVGNQKKLTKDTITVHPAYEIEWDKNVRLCDGSEGFVQITKIAPSEVTVDWEDDDCLISGSNSGANVKAIYEGKDTKEFILVASNGGICDDKRIPVSVKIDKKIEGEIKAPDIVCEGNVASLTANYDADIFLWKADDDLSNGLPKIGKTAQVTSKPGYAHFIVVMQRGACSDSSDVYVEVTEKPKFEAIDSLSYKSVNIVLQGNTGTAPYKYIVDDNYEDDINSSIKVDLDYGQHKVTVIDTAGCVIDTMITINFPSFNIPIVVSPNGDNHNDAFTVPVLRDAYPDATIRIFDRWGKKLADYKAGDGIDWDGTYNGVAMPTTDYWYEIEIKEIKKTYSGHFTLIRQ